MRTALFLSPCPLLRKKGKTGMEDADIGSPRNYRAKLAYASCRTARSGRKRFRKKSSSPRGLRYFSRKPCLSGSICRRALVVQRAAKARVFTLKNKEYATSDHHKTVTSSDRDARDKKTESTRPATGNQAATKGNHRSRSHLKAAEPRSGNLQTSGQEQAAGRTLQRILKHIV